MVKTSNLKKLSDARARDLLKGPNVLSLSRIIVAGLIIWIYQSNGHQLSWSLIVVVIYGILSDYLDGYWARWRGEVSDLGNALDPLTDKISSGLLFLYAVWIGRIPEAYLLFVVARDLVIMAASLYIKRLTGRMPAAIISGKISINAVAAYWVASFFAPDARLVIETLMWLSIVLMVYSFGDYMFRYLRTFQKITGTKSR